MEERASFELIVEDGKAAAYGLTLAPHHHSRDPRAEKLREYWEGAGGDAPRLVPVIPGALPGEEETDGRGRGDVPA